MNNAIVYSIHAGEGTLNKNYSFEQLKVSVNSIREFNQDIDIIVYFSPITSVCTDMIPLMQKGVEFIPFTAKADPRIDHKLYALWTSHKWENSFKALRDFELDNVLYVDTDTVFQRDPNILFKKYGNSKSIFGKPDVSDKYTKLFNAKKGGMNDGQYLLSKHVLKYEKDLLKARIDYVLHLQEIFKDHEDEDLRINGVQWVSCQYGISEYLYHVGNPLRFFDEKDVYIVHRIEEFRQLPRKIIKNFVLIHYLNYNTYLFAPKAYEVYKAARNV